MEMKKQEQPVLVTRSSLPPLEEFVEMLKPIWDSAWLTNMGRYHETFKDELRQYLTDKVSIDFPEVESEK